MVDSVILNQLDIKNDNAIEAHLKNALSARYNCAESLLHIDITAKDIGYKKLSSILELISKNFESVTIFIDTQLAVLTYSIIMPYMSAQQLQNIVNKRKSDWLSEYMALIGKLEVPWSIVTNEEPSIQQIKNSSIVKISHLSRSNCTFRNSLEQDIKLLKSCLLRGHSLKLSLYNQEKNKNDLAIKNYLISRIATITALGNYNCAYITLNQIYSYLFLYKTSAVHNIPQLLTLSFKSKLKDNEVGSINKVSKQKQDLGKVVRNTYPQTSNRNKKQQSLFGVDDNITETAIAGSQDLDINMPFISMKMLLRNQKNKDDGILGFSIHKAKLDNMMRPVITKCDDEYINKLQKNILMMPGNLMWYDINGNILGCNQNQANLLNIDLPENIIGKTYHDFLIPDHIKPSQQLLLDIFATKKPITTEEVYRTVAGFKVIVSNKTPLEDNNGNIIGVMALAIDMSHENQHKIDIARQKEKLAIVKNFTNQFVENIEIDMRQPFERLCSMTETYASEEEDLDKKNQLYEISNCAKELLCYCDWLSEINNYSSNDKNLISIKKLTKSIINLHLTEIKDKNLDLKLDYDNNIPDNLLGDSYRVKRILKTLITNSVKYTQSGHINLSIRLCPKSTSTIIFSITDSGPLISTKNYQHISTEQCSFSGKCICLNETKKFVADLGGAITIDGSCIAITLGFEKTNDIGKGLDTRRLEHIALELGMYSKNVATTSSILSILKDKHFDIVLLDIGLEEIEGYALARQIRDVESKNNHDPAKIVVITSRRCKTRSRIAKELNITAYFIEKSKVSEITNMIKESLPIQEACPIS